MVIRGHGGKHFRDGSSLLQGPRPTTTHIVFPCGRFGFSRAEIWPVCSTSSVKIAIFACGWRNHTRKSDFHVWVHMSLARENKNRKKNQKKQKTLDQVVAAAPTLSSASPLLTRHRRRQRWRRLPPASRAGSVEGEGRLAAGSVQGWPRAARRSPPTRRIRRPCTPVAAGRRGGEGRGRGGATALAHRHPPARWIRLLRAPVTAGEWRGGEDPRPPIGPRPPTASTAHTLLSSSGRGGERKCRSRGRPSSPARPPDLPPRAPVAAGEGRGRGGAAAARRRLSSRRICRRVLLSPSGR